MSCDRETNKFTVLGDFDVNDRRGRHRSDDDYDRDFYKALHDAESHRDLIREIVETRSAAVAETKEAKHDIVVQILQNRTDQERIAREQLRDLVLLFRGRGRECCDDH